MFTTKELNLIDERYFLILRYPSDENFIEIQSRNSKDYWIIQKRKPEFSKYPIILYHKHPGQRYYHRHWQCYKVSQSVRSIKSHDEYSKLRKWNQRFQPLSYSLSIATTKIITRIINVITRPVTSPVCELDEGVSLWLQFGTTGLGVGAF